MTKFYACDLEDIAAEFDRLAEAAVRTAARCESKRQQAINNSESRTWVRAAELLRGTTLSVTPVGFAPTEEIERLREALRPFLRGYQSWMDEYTEGEMTTYSRITFAEFHRARAAVIRDGA